jgi:hypothetical protein
LLPQNGAPPYDVSWTLECELVFYALAAIIIPIAGIPGLAVVLAGLAMAGLYYGNPWSYRLISTHQADFLGGVLVFMGATPPAGVVVYCGRLCRSVSALRTRRLNFAFSGTVPLGLILPGDGSPAIALEALVPALARPTRRRFLFNLPLASIRLHDLVYFVVQDHRLSS